MLSTSGVQLTRFLLLLFVPIVCEGSPISSALAFQRLAHRASALRNTTSFIHSLFLVLFAQTTQPFQVLSVYAHCL
ncbi:hypothetical protein IQ07DRAFT_584943 [Pyrenochaeta sp. DS3sAY3a]|nr:hypothetical protein IQ07DRAFT_584943 [Pyrenochaeta sp. DS3sAY3a]